MTEKINQKEIDNYFAFKKLIKALSDLNWRDMLQLSKMLNPSYKLAFEGRAIEKRFGSLEKINSYIKDLLNSPEGGTWEDEFKLVRMIYAYKNKDNIPFDWKHNNASLSTAWKHVVGLKG